MKAVSLAGGSSLGRGPITWLSTADKGTFIRSGEAETNGEVRGGGREPEKNMVEKRKQKEKEEERGKKRKGVVRTREEETTVNSAV